MEGSPYQKIKSILKVFFLVSYIVFAFSYQPPWYMLLDEITYQDQIYRMAVQNHSDTLLLTRYTTDGRELGTTELVYNNYFTEEPHDFFEENGTIVDDKGEMYLFISSRYKADAKDQRSQALIVKYSAEGKVLWVQKPEYVGYISDVFSNAEDRLSFIGFNKQGQIVLEQISAFGDAIAFEILSIPFAPDSRYHSLAFDQEGNILLSKKGSLLKSNRNGKVLWQAATSGDTIIGVDEENNIYLTGLYTSGELSKYSPRGQLLWTTLLTEETSSLSEDIFPTQVRVNKKGEVYVAGTYDSHSQGVFLAKLDNRGKIQWRQKNATGHQRDEVPQITLDKNDNAYLSGVYEVHLDDHLFSAKYNPEGKRLWLKRDGRLTITTHTLLLFLNLVLASLAVGLREEGWKKEAAGYLAAASLLLVLWYVRILLKG